jgi:hypothetical protein
MHVTALYARWSEILRKLVASFAVIENGLQIGGPFSEHERIPLDLRGQGLCSQRKQSADRKRKLGKRRKSLLGFQKPNLCLKRFSADLNRWDSHRARNE